MACRNGVCGLKPLPKKVATKPAAKAAPNKIQQAVRASPGLNVQASSGARGIPINSGGGGGNGKDNALSQRLLNQIAVPAQVNAARTQQATTERAAPAHPIRNELKNDYKHTPYLRTGNGQAGNAIGAAAAGAMAGAELGSKSGNPYVTAATTAAGGIAGAFPSIYSWAKNKHHNNKIKHYVHDLNKYLKKPNQNDPKLQSKILHAQEKLNFLSPGKLAPGQEKLPIDQQHAIIDKSVITANERGSSANYEGKIGTPTYKGADNKGVPGGGDYNNTLQLPRYTGPQVGLQNELIERLQNNPADFGAIRQNELRRFQTETHPQVLEQAFGRNPYQSGSGQEYQLQKSSEGLADRLAAMQSKFELQQEGNYLQGALQPTFENLYIPPAAPQQPQAPWWHGVLKQAGPKALEYGAEKLGNYMNKKSDQAAPATNVSGQYDQQPTQYVNQPNSIGDNGNMFSSWNPDMNSMVAAEQKAIGQNALKSLVKANHQLGGGSR